MLVVEGVLVFLSQIWLRQVRAIWGIDKNEFGKVNLVGPGTRASRVVQFRLF